MYGNWGGDGYGSSPYGGIYPPFGLESAQSLSATSVRVRFTALVDYGSPAILTPGNYQIAPALNVLAVVPESACSVILITAAQDQVQYTITVGSAVGYFGQSLDPSLNSVTFNGDSRPSFYPVATAPRRVRAVFSTPMLDNAALVDPASYSVTDLQLNSVNILSVQKEQSTNIRSVVLTVDTDWADEGFYQMVISPLVVSADSLSLVPSSGIFQWAQNELRVSIPLSLFTGEVTDPLYGVHNGLVFFSPSLLTQAPNSTIQIDEVKVCTKAYDEYHFPQPVDPRPLFTHGSGVVGTSYVTTLNADVLWAPFPRLFEATTAVSDTQEDTILAPTDGPATATFTEAWDLSYVSLLNNTEWKLFDNGPTPPEYFKTADNTAPIPPGSTVVVVLQP